MAFILVADWMFQRFAPGIFWLAPAALIGAMVIQKKFDREDLVFIIASVIIDLVSGIPFGWVTLACLIMLGLIHVLRRWVRLVGMHPTFFGIYAIGLTAIFALMLAFPLGITTIIRQLPVFLLQSLAPLILISYAIT